MDMRLNMDKIRTDLEVIGTRSAAESLGVLFVDETGETIMPLLSSVLS